ncbi:MAG: 2-oxoacid:acceptor oxidoreductase subunit alpha [Bacteroidota bacterium]|nr:2-oxoacid:acceptor oxidoreductase subunit alpha [Bacteroidota bacterium]
MAKEANVVEKEEVVVRFSGDSGDGMQLTGTLFSDTLALGGNDISTFPDFPSEIRAPQGTVAGVSGFQVNFGNTKISTPGDYADVLVAMNPAAIKANIKFTKHGGTIIFDRDSFNEKNLVKAGYKTLDPIAEDKLEDFNIIPVGVTSLTKETLKDLDLDNKSVLRCKNMFALGLICWIFDLKLDHIESYIRTKFRKKPIIVEANLRVLKSGYNYGENIQELTPRYLVNPAEIEPGIYRNISGNVATAWGLLAASEKSGRELFLGSYPITPATDVLQTLANRKDLGVKTFQAEDEIAGICTSLGAAFAGDLAVTSTSGPGFALKSEGLGLAVMAELPIVVVNVQRAGPSTGIPTKTEQSDLLQALYGRNGESPCVVIAATTPSDCFYYAFMAAKIALERMTPVVLLTDGFLANGSEPWKIPSMSDMPAITPNIAKDAATYKAYARDPQTFAREWAFPGMEGFQHRIGGLEKGITGSVNSDFNNHQDMTDARAAKVAQVVDYVPDLEVLGEQEGELLVVGWGGTFGHLATAVRQIRNEGKSISLAQFNFINPLPANTSEVFAKFRKIVVCELNMGQFAGYLRDKEPGFEYYQYNKVMGQPFTVHELVDNFKKHLEE